MHTGAEENIQMDKVSILVLLEDQNKKNASVKEELNVFRIQKMAILMFIELLIQVSTFIESISTIRYLFALFVYVHRPDSDKGCTQERMVLRV